MPSEADEIQVNYFALCDQVITEAQTSKQSLIGVYSALMAEQFPTSANVVAAVGLRVQSARLRDIRFRFTGPDGQQIFATPSLPCDWDSVQRSLQTSEFATIQMGLNLQSMPFAQAGIYTAALYADGALIATYPINVLNAAQTR